MQCDADEGEKERKKERVGKGTKENHPPNPQSQAINYGLATGDCSRVGGFSSREGLNGGRVDSMASITAGGGGGEKGRKRGRKRRDVLYTGQT
jgi:hypothetical protein